MRWKTSKCGRKLKSVHMGPSTKLKMIYPIQNYKKKTLYVSLGPLEVKIFISTFTYVYSCVSMWWYIHTSALANENQERVVAVITDGCPTWVLETKLRFSIVALSDF